MFKSFIIKVVTKKRFSYPSPPPYSHPTICMHQNIQGYRFDRINHYPITVKVSKGKVLTEHSKIKRWVWALISYTPVKCCLNTGRIELLCLSVDVQFGQEKCLSTFNFSNDLELAAYAGMKR